MEKRVNKLVTRFKNKRVVKGNNIVWNQLCANINAHVADEMYINFISPHPKCSNMNIFYFNDATSTLKMLPKSAELYKTDGSYEERLLIAHIRGNFIDFNTRTLKLLEQKLG